MSVARIHTEAETALFEAFDAAGLSGDGRTAALDSLKEAGLPTRKVESFHYTDLRARLRGDFRVTGAPSNDDAKAAGAKFPRLASGACVLHFRDGHLIDPSAFEGGEVAPDGVTISHDLPAPFETDGPDDTVVALNNAFAQGGVAIEVAAGADVSQTIGLAHTPTAENAVAAMRSTIAVGEGATANFIERGVGPDGMHYLASSAVSLDIADGATVGYIVSNEEGDAAQRLARLSVRLGAKATLNLFVLNLGSRLTRQELDFKVAGEGAALVVNGINLVGGEAHIDVTSRIDHSVPGCTAEETFRNVCTGRGVGVFQGQINVAQAAQQTDARMACNTLLLSDECEFNAKPELEIFADDVQCAHGATVTDLEESYLFYLRSRGIGEADARRMLIKAFVAEVMEDMDEEIAGALDGRIDAWMERHI